MTDENEIEADDFVFDPVLDFDTSEFKIHIAIADFLSGRQRRGNKVFQTTAPFPGMLVTHAYQGRNEEEGFFLKMMGVKPGIADLLCWYRLPHISLLKRIAIKFKIPVSLYGCSFLEVKKPGNYQSAPQKKIQGWCGWLGIPYQVVHSEKEAYEHFIKQGLKSVHAAYRNTDTRTDSQKKQDVFNLYKPLK